ncbi:MAG: cyclic nucleotide-binding domain-containing protein [Xanthobacteraceae bacterium]
MTIEDEIAFLSGVPVLGRLGDGALRSLAIAAETHAMEVGEVLFAAGEAADGAYIVQQGTVSLQPASGAEVVVGPGTLLGESALLTETRRPATATAREPGKALRISRATFLKVLDSYPDAALRLREVLASRTDQWARDMENIRGALARLTERQDAADRPEGSG